MKPWDGWGRGEQGAEQDRGEEPQRAELWRTIGQFWQKWGCRGMKLVENEAGHVIRDQHLKDLTCLIEEDRLHPEGIGEF